MPSAAAPAITDLNKVLSYENSEVVRRFAEDFGFSQADAEAIFIETKRWLWLCALNEQIHRGRQPLTMFEESQVIDWMWHTFILFTKDYADFCHKYFGRFLHHVPMTVNAKATKTKEERLAEVRFNYEFIYDHLGPEVLKRWCEELPRPKN